ncbi:MAG: hypothetical protein ACREP9_10920, partial [Candidatus Dormibacteraceae bacterium]
MTPNEGPRIVYWPIITVPRQISCGSPRLTNHWSPPVIFGWARTRFVTDGFHQAIRPRVQLETSMMLSRASESKPETYSFLSMPVR